MVVSTVQEPSAFCLIGLAIRVVGWAPAAAGIHDTGTFGVEGGIAFVEHQHDSHALLRVLPQRRSLDALHGEVDIVVAARDDRAARGGRHVVGHAGAVARGARGATRHGARHADAVHVVALVGHQEVQVADIAAGQVGAELVVVVVRGNDVVGTVLQVGVPLAVAHRAVAVLPFGRAAHVLVGHAWVMLGLVQACGHRQRERRIADGRRVAGQGARRIDVVLCGDRGIGDAVGTEVLPRVHRLAVRAPREADARDGIEEIGPADDVVVRGLRARGRERRLGQARLRGIGRGQVLDNVGTGRAAVPLVVVGDAPVVRTAQGRVVGLARVAGGVVAHELIASLQVAVDLGRVGRVQDRQRRLVLQHHDEDRCRSAECLRR